MVEVTWAFEQLGPWNRPETGERRRDDFRRPREGERWGREPMPWSDIVIAADIDARNLSKRDGKPLADARAGFPGVVVTISSPSGPLVFGTDRFLGWQANVRAVALALEALRKVARYGVADLGQQYAGFRALTAGSSLFDRQSAAAWVAMRARECGLPTTALDLLNSPSALRQALRLLTKKMHSDHGGAAEDWALLDAARQALDPDASQRILRQDG